MKKVRLLLLLLTTALAVSAQKTKQTIQQGQVLNYTLQLHGQQVAFALTIKRLADTVVLGWKMRNTTSGTYIILPDAFRKASKLNFVQPEPDRVVVLPPDQTFFLISKLAFNNLRQKHQFIYDNTVYNLDNDNPPFTTVPGVKNLSTLHVTAQNETTEFWILNNPDFPVICRIKGNPLGVDMVLNAIE